MSRAYTTDEVREAFVKAVQDAILYWNGVPDRTRLGALSGLAFSLLAMLDGANLDLPKFALVADPHPDDQAFHQEQGENWYVPLPEGVEVLDISGWLHEIFYSEEFKQRLQQADSED